MKNKKKLIIFIVLITLIAISLLLFLLLKNNLLKNTSLDYTNNEVLNIENIPESDKQISLNLDITNTVLEANKNSIKCIEAQKKEENSQEQTKFESEELQKPEELKITTLNTTANNIAQNYSNVTRIEYGTSVQGRPLEAYLITGNGSNTKTIFMEFEVHGYEDEYAKDGKVLVDLANQLVEYYANNANCLMDYKMIIVPSANPDGVIDGNNNLRVGNSGAFGRCTASGIDINRDFKNGYFNAIESQKLRDLMNKYPMNIHLDFHGWEDSCIGSPIIVKAFLEEVGLTTDKSNRYGSGQGYVIEYTKDVFGANSALVEFRNSNSVYAPNVENAINRIMQEI